MEKKYLSKFMHCIEGSGNKRDLEKGSISVTAELTW